MLRSLREASDGDIHNAFRMLGVLQGAEQHEGDEEGLRQVQHLVLLLRQFKQHEQAEHGRRSTTEATYGEPGGTQVWYDNGHDAIRDATDLYTVLEEQHGTGSPNLENLQARDLVGHLQRGAGLGEVQIGLLRRLLAKHQAEIDQLRSSRDRDGQDVLDVPEGGAHERIITTGGRP